MKKSELEKYVISASEAMDDLPPMIRDAKLISIILHNADIFVLPENTFFVSTDAEGIMMQAIYKRLEHIRAGYPDGAEEFRVGERLLAYTGCYDFGHAVPDCRPFARTSRASPARPKHETR